jgi:hypothetical protein
VRRGDELYTYMVRQDIGQAWTVSKWKEDALVPREVYKVEKDKRGKMKCTCPSGICRGYCKHTEMVKSQE